MNSPGPWDDYAAPATVSGPWDDYAPKRSESKKWIDAPKDAPKETGGLGRAFLGGLERGAASIPGIVGDIQELSRAAGRKLGFEPPKRSILDRAATTVGMDKVPTSADTVNAAAPYLPDVNYQPQTTGEKYASTIGSFLPGAVLAGGGGGLAGAARNAIQYGAIPAFASEAAGQATEGTKAEPYARFAGGLLGGMAGPSLTNIPGRVISPIRANPEIAGEVSLLQSEGVPLTAGQKTGSRGLRWLEATAMDQPLASRSVEDIAQEQGRAVTKAFTKRTGYETPVAKDDYWRNTSSALGGEYQNLLAGMNLPVSQQLQGDVATKLVDYLRRVGGQQNQAYSNIVEKYVQDIGRFRQQGGMSGQQYQTLREQLQSDIKAAPNSATETALSDIRKALDAEAERHTPGMADLNKRYAIFKDLESAASKRGEQTARGYLEPGKVQNEVARWNGPAFTRGRSEIGNIAQAFEAVGGKLPQSGTQPRTQAQKLLNLNNLVPAMLGAGAGGVAGGAPGAALGLLAAEAVPIAMGKAVMSGPVQGWLGNQAAQRLGLLSYPSEQQKIRGLLADLYASQVQERR